MDRFRCAIVLTCLFAGFSTSRADDSSPAFFENEIRPLLVQRCIQCHGPQKSESGLRLDSIAAAIAGGDQGKAIVPRDPKNSLLLKAIRHQDGLEMPPNEQLEDREIAAIERWIRGGAIWPDGAILGIAAGPDLRGGPITAAERAFWSIQPIDDLAPPKLAGEQVGNDIDRFVIAKLRDAHLTAARPATRYELIRRATFDLTGLPPTPQEIEAFIADQAPDAFEKVVERLLKSDTYGERWGRHWLDVVRYADTAGETADYPTPLSYKYRNWVINAFNADMPYDRFVREQLAGDILAKRTADISHHQYEQMLMATGFIAISRRFGFDVENYHHLTIQDTIDTVGQAFLGLTLGCARCHDHKYDPVNTADYYGWYGIFESTRYSFPGSEEKKRPYDSFPVLPPEVAQRVKIEHEATLGKLDAEIKRLEAEAKALVGGWNNYIKGRRLRQFDGQRDGHDGFLAWHNDPLPIVAVNTSAATLKVPGTAPPKKVVVHPQQQEGVGLLWHSPIVGKVRVTGLVKDAHDCGDSVDWFLDHLASAGFKNIVSGATQRNGSRPIDAVEFDVKAGELIQLAIMPKSHYGCDLTEIDLTIKEVGGDRTWDLARDVVDGSLTSNPSKDHYDNPDVWYFTQVEVDRGESFGKGNENLLGTVDRDAVRDKRQRIERQLAETRQRHRSLSDSGPYDFVYAAVDKEETKNARIRIRGDRKKLGDEVPRKNLEILGDDRLPGDAGSGRLEMADWLTRDQNPLMARVMANRIWQHHFGRGIVGTENDFGARGQRPTHPKLLDWLASRFKESGYSIKTIHRLIMSSAAYQRSSEYDPTAAERDPEARWLWRFNRRRLSAEEIRDAMLFVAGNLDPSMGGDHPFPPVHQWGFTQHAPFYGDYDTNRRSVYLMQQRIKRHPFLALFDGADTNVSTGRRKLTTVPTQALFLMNNEFVHQQSDGLAKRLIAQRDDETSRVDLGYHITLGRRPSPSERVSAIEFLSSYRDAMAAADLPADVREQTLWSALARTLLTRNEFLFVD